ncbi:succinate dehydrogenase cytochrome b subunit [Corynebacterium ulceribovis]|uniref:succinate dehydrogenase cytochrome b subunit n=1 Tax=Corynebacterium ulceribovis TaxID=487732 RepID=UPI00037F6316|nr:succinate dehydrogenase cytochrome b subunit [Corynebacterium ulceribovis]
MTVKTNRDAIAHGKITEAPLRERPKFPSWALKLAMAVTGLIFALFVIVHMVGNLKVYMGAEHFNAYAEFLRTVGEPLLPREGMLWIFRITLLASLIIHVYGALALTGRSSQSRGKFRRTNLVSGWNTFTTRSMLITGVILLLFIIFHLLDLTIGVEPAASAVFEHGEAYANLISSFDRLWVAIVYILANLALLLHLSHGIWLATSDFGITGKRWRQVMLFLAGLVPVLVVAGNISIPLAVQFGWLSL